MKPQNGRSIGLAFVIPALALVIYFLLGQRAAIFVLLAWPLWLAWQFDNAKGAFLILGTIIYIVLFVLAFLLTLIVAMHTYFSIRH